MPLSREPDFRIRKYKGTAHIVDTGCSGFVESFFEPNTHIKEEQHDCQCHVIRSGEYEESSEAYLDGR
jgi:hypothetical protein